MSVAAPVAADRRGAVLERAEITRPIRAFEVPAAAAAELELPRRFRGRTLLVLLVCGQAVWFVILGFVLMRLGT